MAQVTDAQGNGDQAGQHGNTPRRERYSGGQQDASITLSGFPSGTVRIERRQPEKREDFPKQFQCLPTEPFEKATTQRGNPLDQFFLCEITARTRQPDARQGAPPPGFHRNVPRTLHPPSHATRVDLSKVAGNRHGNPPETGLVTLGRARNMVDVERMDRDSLRAEIVPQKTDFLAVILFEFRWGIMGGVDRVELFKYHRNLAEPDAVRLDRQTLTSKQISHSRNDRLEPWVQARFSARQLKPVDPPETLRSALKILHIGIPALFPPRDVATAIRAGQVAPCRDHKVDARDLTDSPEDPAETDPAQRQSDVRFFTQPLHDFLSTNL